jgi:hypothetical protein
MGSIDEFAVAHGLLGDASFQLGASAFAMTGMHMQRAQGCTTHHAPRTHAAA